MNDKYATQVSCAKPGKMELPESPVSRAFRLLDQEISDLHFDSKTLVESIGAVLSPEPDEEATTCNAAGTPPMESGLVDLIYSFTSRVREARRRLSSARERVTL